LYSDKYNSNIYQTINKLNIGKSWTIVIGREVGTQIFPSALIKILLYVNKATRNKRKFLQIKNTKYNFFESNSVEKSEPNRLWKNLDEDTFFIDATFLTLEQVVEKALKHISGNFHGSYEKLRNL
jgi:cytidylate kinase